jgi:pimeloyl-ACP methyl ester carboxylesterase
VAPVKWRTVQTRKGTRCRVLEGGSGAPVVFLHGAGGLLRDNPFLDRLARRYHVFAPEWPGYGESTGEELLEDMLDFTLHGWDLVDALELRHPHLLGHSMGGMIAAEMACVAPREVGKLVLASPAGLWLPEHPVPDIFAMLPGQLAEALFADAGAGQALLTGGADLSNLDALREFHLGTQRRLAMAGKILFPIPNRRLSKRLYRLAAETLLLWGAGDRLVVPAYAQRWLALLPGARLETIEGAGHMLPWEQPEAFARAVAGFLA